MRVVVDLDKCIGGGQCVRAAPLIFEQNEDDGLAIILMENPPQELHASARDAARLCPAIAISIVDENG